MLAIEIEFLTGRYVATDYADRTKAEWPPHPARLFSALVATLHARGNNASERAALSWLEQQGAPCITASEASARTVSTHFVPVNDTTAGSYTRLDKKALALSEAEGAVEDAQDDKQRRRAAKKRDKARDALDKASTKEASAPYKVPKKLPGVMPSSRLRQARTFPSVHPHEDRVVFAWPDAKPDPSVFDGLGTLVPAVVRLGHSSSLVRCAVKDEAPEPTLVPHPAGSERLRTVRPGQLDQLEDAFGRHQGWRGRVLPAQVSSYRSTSHGSPSSTQSSLDGEWILFRARGDRLELAATVGLARLFRAALLDAMTDDSDAVPPILSGHDADGRPTRSPHAAIWPLPFVGHRHADGTVKGVAIHLPSQASADERRLLLRAIGALERRHDATPEPGQEPALTLFLREGPHVVLERAIEPPRLWSLRRDSWSAPSRRWATATPIALPRHPGRLQGRPGPKLDKAWEKAEQGVRDACERVGLPHPEAVRLSLSPVLRGSAKTKRFPAFPASNHKGPRRMLVHAELFFAEPVGGPLVLGAGRHFGLGLCWPVSDGELS